jgi:hypothetical protein
MRFVRFSAERAGRLDDPKATAPVTLVTDAIADAPLVFAPI